MQNHNDSSNLKEDGEPLAEGGSNPMKEILEVRRERMVKERENVDEIRSDSASKKLWSEVAVSIIQAHKERKL